MENNNYCDFCGNKMVSYKTTLTHRHAIFLMSMSYLMLQTGEEYIHYNHLHQFTRENFNGMCVSNFTKMYVAPWHLIEPCDSDQPKYKRGGYWRITDRGQRFIHGKTAITETAHFNSTGCYLEVGKVFVSELKKMNFREVVDKFKSF